jgi:hypothetical protein
MPDKRMLTVFRVTGLRTSQSDDALERALKIVIHKSMLKEEISNINFELAIVPSCYDVEQKRVALVKFRGEVPQFLSQPVGNPSGYRTIEMGGTYIKFDRDFSGFTQLYAPQPGRPVTAE